MADAVVNGDFHGQFSIETLIREIIHFFSEFQQRFNEVLILLQNFFAFGDYVISNLNFKLVKTFFPNLKQLKHNFNLVILLIFQHILNTRVFFENIF